MGSLGIGWSAGVVPPLSASEDLLHFHRTQEIGGNTGGTGFSGGFPDSGSPAPPVAGGMG